ncbi:unnamed protein product [Malus baccata var. baccata]
MEPPPLPGSPNVYPTSLFSYVDSKTPLKNIDQVRGKLDYETSVVKYWNHKLMKVEKKLVDLNGKANKALYHASKITPLNFELWQKRRGHIESYERSQEGKVELEKKRNKGFKYSHRLVK